MLNIYEQVDQNKRKSWMLMAGFVAFVVIVAWILSEALGYGQSITAFAILMATLGSIGSYYFSDKIILGLSGAREASREKDFHFYTVTENLCLAAQLPVPKLYVIDDTAMNAFATGRDPQHAAIAATRGLLDKLDRTQLEGVVAHELSHIRNFDIRLMTLTTVLVGIIALLADWFLRATYWGGRRKSEKAGQATAILFLLGFLLALLAPLIANIIKLTISRQREYLADASGVQLTKFPQGLRSALEKLGADREPLEVANKATAHLYITNPFHLDRQVHPERSRRAIGWFAGLFNTHPPLADRISALQKMETL